MGIYAVVQVRNPRGDTDFCLAGCHGKTHTAKVTAGRRVRQIGVQIFSDLRKIRCLDIGFSGFRCGGFGCLRCGCGILCKSGHNRTQICERNSTRQQHDKHCFILCLFFILVLLLLQKKKPAAGCSGLG